jgi:hypothetical protein
VVAVDGRLQASALLGGIACMSAGARIRRRDEREARGIRGRGTRPRDRDRAFLERLAQCVEDDRGELPELVEEQRTAVRRPDSGTPGRKDDPITSLWRPGAQQRPPNEVGLLSAYSLTPDRGRAKAR